MGRPSNRSAEDLASRKGEWHADRNLNMCIRLSFVAIGAVGLLTWPVRAWDAVCHSLVSQLALAALPKDFPDFVQGPAEAERIAFLANVPDRWRSVDPWLRQSGGSWTDHFFDVEQIADAGLDIRRVSSLRYDFVVSFAAGRAANIAKFHEIDPAKNSDHTQEWPGFSPWAMAEYYHKLRAAISSWKAFVEVGGTDGEIFNARADIVNMMGILAHYVGDSAQPLHTTVHYNGWSGANPQGYTVWRGFHSWIDGGFAAKAQLKLPELRARVTPAEPIRVMARSDGRDPFFVAMLEHVIAQNARVEPLYVLEKAGLLGHGAQAITAEGRAFISEQLLVGGQMLACVWLTAWQSAPVDTYLRTQLGKRADPVRSRKPASP